jgi:RNA polymerase sigma factor (sigma-70 family)
MLPHPAEFARLAGQVRDHDPNAFTDLLSRYEPDVCRLVESRLRCVRLRRLVDAEDVWQAVLLRLLTRTGDGRLALEDPARLLHLLQKMALNELRDQARWGRRERRDVARELAGGEGALESCPDPRPSPAQLAEDRDLIDDALHHLHRKERLLAVGWAAGKDWDELARETGGTAESVRKQFSRAMTRLASLRHG